MADEDRAPPHAVAAVPEPPKPATPAPSDDPFEDDPGPTERAAEAPVDDLDRFLDDPFEAEPAPSSRDDAEPPSEAPADDLDQFLDDAFEVKPPALSAPLNPILGSFDDPPPPLDDHEPPVAGLGAPPAEGGFGRLLVERPVAVSEVRRLMERLAAEPWAFDFFQALRRLDAVHPELARFGESIRLTDPVRLGQLPSLIFAPATLSGFEPATGDRPARLYTYFFGMFGPSGALPIHLTEFARDRLRNERDPTMVAFLNILHHRFLSLYYRAWATARPTVSFDRPAQDRFGAYIGSLFGLGMPSQRRRDGMPDLTKLHFAGRLGLQTRNCEGLQAIIADYFKLPVWIEEFVPQWVRLPLQSLCMLGVTPDTGTLGTTASIGERIKTYHLKFRIHIGPLTLEEFHRLLPSGMSLDRLEPIVRNYIGDEFSWDVNLIMKRLEVPPMKLGQGTLLGWTGWLGERRKESDADELILEPDVRAA